MAYGVQVPAASRTTTKSMANRPSTPSRARRLPMMLASALMARA
jgi:hypothetical protein